MRKNKLFLILSGCVTAVVGIFYLHFFGFEKSQFRVDVPKWSGISWQKPVKISRAESMNDYRLGNSHWDSYYCDIDGCQGCQGTYCLPFSA